MANLDPGLMNSLAGLLSTLASIFGAQHGPVLEDFQGDTYRDGRVDGCVLAFSQPSLHCGSSGGSRRATISRWASKRRESTGRAHWMYRLGRSRNVCLVFFWTAFRGSGDETRHTFDGLHLTICCDMYYLVILLYF